MKHYRSLLLLPFVLTGCATTDMQGALDSMNGLGKSIGSSLSQAATPASAANRNSLLGTPLHNALRHNLSTDGRTPEWPKVVISNLQIPADQMTLTRSLTLKASDCIHFDAVLCAGAAETVKQLSADLEELFHLRQNQRSGSQRRANPTVQQAAQRPGDGALADESVRPLLCRLVADAGRL